MSTDTAIDARRAIEALRAGVPNRDAVRALGCDQPEIEERFRQLLAAARQDPAPASGLLVQGDFGTGKSHLLAYLERVALDGGFVCSRVVISKETPLYDPVRVARATLRGSVVPGRRGPGIRELAALLQPESEGYAALEAWAQDRDQGLNPRFPVSLSLFRRMGVASEAGDRVVSFWSGEPLGAGEVKRYLRACGDRPTGRLESATQRDLALQRLRFAPRLARAAGLAGWVLLLDEVELIGSYSVLQRGRSYAELARWLGKVRSEPLAGLCTVLAIMSNYETEVLERKGDLETVAERLRCKGQGEAARWAEQGMRALRRDRLRLHLPSLESLLRVHDTVRRLHGQAHGWQPPAGRPESRLSSTALREHIRSWINDWDLQRLYPGYRPGTVVRSDEVRRTYEEDADLEAPADDGSPDPQDA
ncbi:MAG: BREX system ATP-binding domain-containing protein [Candidatus Latescibacterota bacterium]